MGEVFRAVAIGADGFEKQVVIKRLLPKFAGRADVSLLFSSEAKLMTRLVHPNIVQVIDFGRGENDDYFLVMELVPGLDLGRFSRSYRDRGEPVPLPLVLYVVSQVLRGLAYAHGTFSAGGARLVHRDISPGNVLLSTFGEVKVADFGVALVAAGADAAGTPRFAAGKPGYIAPEQFEGCAVDERADLYSVGALLFEVLTGELPVLDQASSNLSQQALETLGRAVPERVASMVKRALAARPEDRFSDARTMGQAVAGVLQDLGTTTPDDLADAVTLAAEQAPATSKKVIRLGADELAGTELTRLGGEDGGRFTMRITATSEIVPDESAPRRLRPRAFGIALGLLGFALGVVVLMLGPRARRTAAPDVVPRPAASEAVPTPALSESAIVAPIDPVPSTTAALVLAVSAPASAPHVAGKPAMARADTSSTVCQGKLHVFASHGWILKGGPTVVQAPGRYDWPCGAFTVTATSRTNPSEIRRVPISVREGAATVLDLR
jgi:serine/threonine-protein kinase